MYNCTVVDRVMKSKLSHIPHNQYYPRVHTKNPKRGYWMSYKGQLISKDFFVSSILPKNETKTS